MRGKREQRRREMRLRDEIESTIELQPRPSSRLLLSSIAFGVRLTRDLRLLHASSTSHSFSRMVLMAAGWAPVS